MNEEILTDFFDSKGEGPAFRESHRFNQNKSRRDLHHHSSFLTPHSSFKQCDISEFAYD